jgi:hypothetical protein
MARYCTSNEAIAFDRYIKKAKIGIVEIGVLDGESTRAFAKATNIHVYGIDPIVPDSMDVNLIGNALTVLDNLKDCFNASFIKDYSYNVVKTWNIQFDFIFIDGDHRYESVKKDFFDWYPLLSDQGVVAIHDSAPIKNSFQGWPGPIQLVSEIKEKNIASYIETVDCTSFFRKIIK